MFSVYFQPGKDKKLTILKVRIFKPTFLNSNLIGCGTSVKTMCESGASWVNIINKYDDDDDDDYC